MLSERGEIKKGRRYEALGGINNRKGEVVEVCLKGKCKKRREKRCQRHQKLKYKSILFTALSYLSLTCSLAYKHIHTQIVSKRDPDTKQISLDILYNLPHLPSILLSLSPSTTKCFIFFLLPL